MFCDNESVSKSTSREEITLHKKYTLISWNYVREAISDGWMRVLKEPRETKLADIFTKQFPTKRQEEMLNLIYSCDGNSIRD